MSSEINDLLNLGKTVPKVLSTALGPYSIFFNEERPRPVINGASFFSTAWF